MKATSLFLAIGLLCLATMNSCGEKDVPENIIQQNEKKATEFKAKVTTKGFVVTKFYADKPIDYITDDQEIRSETNLDRYIYEYLKDDRIHLKANSLVEIHQNALKKQGLDSAILKRNWNIFSNRAGVFFDFVDDKYEQRRYRLEEFHDDHFIVYLDWPANDAKIFSKFEFKE